MSARLITAPTLEPVTVDDVLSWGRFDSAENIVLLALAIQQAREEAEHITGRRLLTQTWEIDVLAAEAVDLSGLSPIVSIQNAGVAVPWVDGLMPACTAPSDGVLTVVCGWPNAASVPAGIRMWILHRVITSAELRQFLLPTQHISAAPRPSSAAPRQFADGLLDPYRIPVA